MSLITHNLSIGYRERVVISGINLELKPASLTVLIGANGSGKSTLLRTLTATQPALSGKIEISGKPIESFTPSQLAKQLSLVLTDRTGGGGLRVQELVAIGRHPYSGFWGRLSDDDRRIVNDALQAVGLLHKADEFVASLSDGERQKAFIARAIAQSTDIVVLDEPTSFLDVAARFEIMNLLGKMAHDFGKTVLLSTHDTAAAIASADYIWAIAKEQIHIGTRSQVISSGILDEVFSSTHFDLKLQDFRPNSLI